MSLLLKQVFLTSIFCFSEFYTDWRVQFYDVYSVSPQVNVPFQLVFNNETKWNIDGLSWFADNTLCKMENKSLSSADVTCTQAGIFPFGVAKNGYDDFIAEHRSLFVRPTYYCYHWQISIIKQSENDYQLDVTISNFQQRKGDSAVVSKVHKLKEYPRVIVKSNVLNEADETLQLTFDNNSIWSGTFNYSPLKDSVTIIAESSLNVAIDGCFIKPFRTRLSKPKFSEDILHGLVHREGFVKNIVKQDPYSSHVGIIFVNDGFKLNINYNSTNILGVGSHNNLCDPLTCSFFVEDLLLLKNHIVVYGVDAKFDRKLKVISVGDVWFTVPEDKNVVNGTWMNVYSCNTFPKGLNVSCDFLITLNRLKFVGTFYYYGIMNSELYKYQIPFCESKECHILHVEVSIALDLVRILYKNCNFSGNCDNRVADFYFANNSCIHVLSTSVTVTNFTFFPVHSYDMVFFSPDAIYQVQGGVLWKRYQLSLQDGYMTQTSIVDDTLAVLLSSGFALYIQYGASNVYRDRLPSIASSIPIDTAINEGPKGIFLGVGIHLFPIDRIFHTIWTYNSVVSLHVTPMLVELEAATNGLKESIFSFKTSIKNMVYYLDKYDKLTVTAELIGSSRNNHDIKLIYDSSLGIQINATTTTKTKKSVTGIYKSYDIRLEQTTKSLYPRTTTIAFAPISYDGFYVEHLKPKIMFISIGCIPGRKLLLMTSKAQSCNEIDLQQMTGTTSLPLNNTEQITCAKLQLDELLTIQMKIYTGDVSLDVPVSGSLTLVHGSTVTTMQSDGETVLTPKQTGTYVLYGTVDSYAILCRLESYLVVEVITVPGDNRTLIIVLSITLGVLVCAVFLGVTFFMFKKRTTKEHEAEAESQKRQQELRYLATLEHYQHQMDIEPHPGLLGVAESSSVRRRSTISRRQLMLQRSMAPVAEE